MSVGEILIKWLWLPVKHADDRGDIVGVEIEIEMVELVFGTTATTTEEAPLGQLFWGVWADKQSSPGHDGKEKKAL